MKDIILSLLAGLGVGLFFILIKLPLPAPRAFAGVAGIIGIWLAQLVWDAMSKFIS